MTSVYSGQPMASAPPLANRVAFRSSDVDEVRARITHYFTRHDIRFLDGSARLDTVLRRSSVHQTAINILEYGGNLMIDPGRLEHFYLIHMNLRGECELTHDGGHMIIDQTRAAVCAPHRPHRFWWRPDSMVAAIQIPKDRLESHFRRVTGRAVNDPIDFDVALDLEAPSSKPLLDLISYILHDAGAENGLALDALTAEPLEHALMTALLKVQPGSHSEALLAGGSSVAPAYVRRAEALMLANLARPVRSDELADAAGVTVRTLNSGFQRFRGDSPARYFLGLRLARARRQLLEGRPGQTVADTAFELGFHHLSSFAAAYRQRFDESPSETLRRARDGNG